MLDAKDHRFIDAQKNKALARLENSASGYVLVKRFGVRARTGLKRAIEEGKVEIFATPAGKAYRVVKFHTGSTDINKSLSSKIILSKLSD